MNPYEPKGLPTLARSLKKSDLVHRISTKQTEAHIMSGTIKIPRTRSFQQNPKRGEHNESR